MTQDKDKEKTKDKEKSNSRDGFYSCFRCGRSEGLTMFYTDFDAVVCEDCDLIEFHESVDRLERIAKHAS